MVVRDKKTFPSWVKDGAWLKTFSGKYHVRGFVDGHIVVRIWRRSKQAWYYEVWDPFEVWLQESHGPTSHSK